MAKYILLMSFIYLFGEINLLAQDKIDTDRPDETESAILTPLHYFQAEFGFGKENAGTNNYDLIYPTYLFKYGLTKNFELRLENQLITEHQLMPEPKNTFGLQPVVIGFRTAICSQKNLLPTTALIVHAAMPFLASENFRSKHIAPTILLAFQNDVTKHFGISYNLGRAWDGFSTTPSWVYSLSGGFDLSEKWNAFIEMFGNTANDQTAKNNIDGGIGYYVSNNVKLDVFAGFGISSAADNYFFGIGFSFRVK